MKYALIATFNRSRASGATGVKIRNHQDLCSATEETERYVPLPNIAIPARQTLLAERLRRGKPIRARQSFDFYAFKEKNRRLPPYVQAGRIHNPTSLFDREELVGKIIGVEIEYYPKMQTVNPRQYEQPPPKDNALTQIKSDGSLGRDGVELTRLTWQSPQSGRLTGLVQLNLGPGSRIDKKCGLHIHIDARNLAYDWGAKVCSCGNPDCGNSREDGSHRLSWKPRPDPKLLPAKDTYHRLISLYPLLKRLVPRSRLTNQYCKWISNCDERWASDFAFPYEGTRYAAINFHAFERFGTFEFRCQAGSTNMLKIEQWALVCQRLVRLASNPNEEMPNTWAKFVREFAEPLRSWVILRDRRLGGVKINERSASATPVEVE